MNAKLMLYDDGIILKLKTQMSVSSFAICTVLEALSG